MYYMFKCKHLNAQSSTRELSTKQHNNLKGGGLKVKGGRWWTKG